LTSAGPEPKLIGRESDIANDGKVVSCDLRVSDAPELPVVAGGDGGCRAKRVSIWIWAVDRHWLSAELFGTPPRSFRACWTGLHRF
jgi:hypothetical protein